MLTLVVVVVVEVVVVVVWDISIHQLQDEAQIDVTASAQIWHPDTAATANEDAAEQKNAEPHGNDIQSPASGAQEPDDPPLHTPSAQPL